MKKLRSRLAGVGVLLLVAPIVSVALEPAFRRDTPVKIIAGGNKPGSYAKLLTVVKSQLRFVQAGEGFPAKPGGHELRWQDYSSVFVIDGDTVRVRVTPPEGRPKTGLSKELLAMEGWYMTADYSANTPSVTLTPRPTEYSRWILVSAPATRNEGRCYFIRNQSSQRKNVWLSMEGDDKTYNRGYVRKPTISTEKTTYFRIDYDQTDGSK